MIDPEKYDVDEICYAVGALAAGIRNSDAEDGGVFSKQFTSGTREMIRLVVEVLEDAWRGNGVLESTINFFKNC